MSIEIGIVVVVVDVLSVINVVVVVDLIVEVVVELSDKVVSTLNISTLSISCPELQDTKKMNKNTSFLITIYHST